MQGLAVLAGKADKSGSEEIIGANYRKPFTPHHACIVAILSPTAGENILLLLGRIDDSASTGRTMLL
jgi:hypothetical protein